MLLTDDENIKNLFEKALLVWGEESQKKMAIGECGEFLTEFGREAQKRSSSENMIDEIADVIIMMNQMALIYGEEAVKKRINYKIEKITKKLSKYG